MHAGETIHGIRVFNADRIVYPLVGFTKRDVINYYVRIAPYALPHLKNRPVTLKRYPDEVSGQFFYEKDAPAFTPDWITRFPVWRRSGESQIHYVVIDSLRALVWAASVGTLEIHPFLAAKPDIERPTEVVFDLDPGEGVNILSCARVALLLRDVLNRIELQSFAKVSGSKGIQVYVPLNGDDTYSTTQPFARTVAQLMEREHADLVVAEMPKELRRGRVFVDWSQNAVYKTTVGVYSLRAKRRHPYVSLPVDWDELQQALDEQTELSLYFLPDTALQRVKERGDLFAPVSPLKQQLPANFKRELHLKRAPAAIRPKRPASEPHASAQGSRRRFAVLHRDSDPAYQVIFEVGELLSAFVLPEGIPFRERETCPATVAENIDKAAFERAVGQGRGKVIWDVGTCELIEGNLQRSYLLLFFTGERLRGEWTLFQSAAEDWHISKGVRERSESAPEKRHWPLRQAPAISAVTRETAKRTKPSQLPVDLSALPESQPGFVAPMECKLVPSPPTGDGWLYELKLDGYRVIAVKDATRATLMSRHGNQLNARFPSIAKALRESPFQSAVLDGEIVALDAQGRPSFQDLQNSRTTRLPIVYYVFDVVNYGGRELQGLPLWQRRLVLDTVPFREPIRLAAIVDADVNNFVAEIRRRRLEGIVAKRRESVYEAGKRSPKWEKMRVAQRENFVIGGYLPHGKTFEALLVGRGQGKQLYFVKKLRNGFGPRTRSEVFEEIKNLRVRECPFVNVPEPSSHRGAVDTKRLRSCVWVEPRIRCEVEYAERTRDGRLRHAAFRQIV